MAGIVIGRQDPWPPFAPLPETAAGVPPQAPFPPAPPVDARALLLDHLTRLWELIRHAGGTAPGDLGGTR